MVGVCALSPDEFFFGSIGHVRGDLVALLLALLTQKLVSTLGRGFGLGRQHSGLREHERVARKERNGLNEVTTRFSVSATLSQSGERALAPSRVK